MASRGVILAIVAVVATAVLAGCASSGHPPGPAPQPVEAPRQGEPHDRPTWSRPKDLDQATYELAGGLQRGLPDQSKGKIAVLEFVSGDEKITELGRHISEELVSEFAALGGLDVVERQHLQRIISELRLGMGDLWDPTNARRVGKQAGADAILTGTVTDRLTTLRINARVIDTETGRILAAARSTLTKDDVVNSLESRVVRWQGVDAEDVSETDPPSPTEKPAQPKRKPGLVGNYYNLAPGASDLPQGEPVFRRIDQTLNFQWKTAAPIPRIRPDWFGVRWTGFIRFDKTGMYSFRIGHDDGVRIWIGGAKAYDVWHPFDGVRTTDFHVQEEGWTALRVEFYEAKTFADIRLEWALPGAPDFELVPAAALAHDAQ